MEKAESIKDCNDVFNLTAFVHGDLKHKSEVNTINNMSVIKEDSVILDLACGNGRMCKEFYKYAKYIVGTDICNNFLNYLNIWKVDNSIENVNFKKIDLLDNNFSTVFKMSFDVVLLIGTTQYIINDNNLYDIFVNIKKLLNENGCIITKQTCSMSSEDLLIDKISDELKERYVAKYRTDHSIKQILQKAGFNNISSQNAYNKEDLGDNYYEIERWKNTKQKFFLIKN